MRAAIKAAVFVTVALVLTVLLARCDALSGQKTTSTATTTTVQPPSPSKMEREWRRKVGLTESSPVATSDRSDKLAASILKVAWVPGVQVVSLNVYSTPKLASSLAPALVLAVAKPAHFLRHQFKPILSRLSGNRNVAASYLLFVDLEAKRVMEWYSTPHGGSLYVRRGLESCSPIAAHGWSNLKPCPSK